MEKRHREAPQERTVPCGEFLTDAMRLCVAVGTDPPASPTLNRAEAGDGCNLSYSPCRAVFAGSSSASRLSGPVPTSLCACLDFLHHRKGFCLRPANSEDRNFVTIQAVTGRPEGSGGYQNEVLSAAVHPEGCSCCVCRIDGRKRGGCRVSASAATDPGARPYQRLSGRNQRDESRPVPSRDLLRV